MAKSDFSSSPGLERIVVSGENALREWERIKAEGPGWPIIVGDDKQMEEVMRMIDPRSPAPGDILVRAEGIDFPKELKIEHAALWARVAEEIAADLAKPDEELTDLWSVNDDGEVYEITPQERKSDLRRQLEEGPFPIGDWPEELPQHFGSPPFIDYRGYLLPEINILVIPVLSGPEVFAYLDYTAGNGPAPEYHIAALKRWHAKVGAELFVLNGNTLIFRVTRRPRTREEALELAQEKVLYCRDEERPLALIAHEMMHSDEWFFWWD